MAIITISRGTLSGGAELARCLGAKLNSQIVSREDLVEQASRLYGIEEANLLRGLGRGPRFLERFRIDRRIYLTAARATLCRLVMGDRVVYHGNAGHLLLGGVRHVIRVRIVAPFAQRVEAARREYGLTEKEAEEYVRQMDDERRSWTRFLYGVEWGDPALYDLVINLEKVCCDAACEMVSLLAASPDFEATGEDRKRLEAMFLQAHVKAKLYLNPRIAAAADGIEVLLEDGTVRLRGLVPSTGMLQEVIRTVESLPEVEEVDTEWLGVRELSR